MSTVRGNGAQFTRALRDLGEAWGSTSEGWHDQARRDFAEHHLNELELRARQAMRSVTTLEDLLQNAERDCS